MVLAETSGSAVGDLSRRNGQWRASRASAISSGWRWTTTTGDAFRDNLKTAYDAAKAACDADMGGKDAEAALLFLVDTSVRYLAENVTASRSSRSSRGRRILGTSARTLRPLPRGRCGKPGHISASSTPPSALAGFEASLSSSQKPRSAYAPARSSKSACPINGLRIRRTSRAWREFTISTRRGGI